MKYTFEILNKEKMNAYAVIEMNVSIYNFYITNAKYSKRTATPI